MGKIVRLPENVIKLISAGEVVLGPHSVVKELIENSIDAGSKNIRISLKEGGIKEIIVRDDGCGMDKDDALNALERYSTSKIKEFKDFLKIKTYGFRGEALPSIANVSLLTLSTSNGREGTRVKIKGGEILEVEEINLPKGTQVKVEELFFNTPVRGKSLHSPSWELKRVLKVIIRESLSTLHVFYYAENNGGEVFYSPKRKSLGERIQDIWGKEWRENLLSIDYVFKGIEIKGFCSSPSIGRKAPFYYFYVNNRPIDHRILRAAVKNAYSTYLAKGDFPIVYLFLNMESQEVDVNVHPSKEEVKFREGNIVFEAIRKAIQNAFPKKSVPVVSSLSGIIEEKKSPKALTLEIKDRRENYNKTSLLEQMHRTYLLREIKEGVLVIDQHALHERLIFEKWMEKLKERKKLVQNLLFPVKVEVSPEEGNILKENLDVIREIGVILEEISSYSYLIRAIPSIISGKVDPLSIFSDILDEIKDVPFKISFPERIKSIIKGLSCRAAIKGGDVLKDEEVENLVKMWEEKKEVVTCPHGRPVFIVIKWEELERRFKRR